MYVSADHLLAVALPLIYLADCILLLGHQEIVLDLARGGVRRISFGSGFLLANRRPFMMNPLTPNRLVLKAGWCFDQSSSSRTDAALESAGRIEAALRPVGLVSALAGLLGVLLAPFALLWVKPSAFVVCWLGCVLLVALAGLLAYRRREQLGLSGGVILWTALLGIVCLPCAANIARTLALRTRLRVAMPAFAETVLPAPWSSDFTSTFLNVLTALKRHQVEGSETEQRIDLLARNLRERAS